MVAPERWLVFWIAVAACVGVLLYFSPLLLQDYPNHLARAVVMADLIYGGGDRFGRVFTYESLPTPYILGDWLFAAAVRWLGVAIAARLWIVLVFLSLPCALWTYLRAKSIRGASAALLLVLSLYFSADTFFVLGFTNFRLAVAAVLATLAVAEPLSRQWSVVRYVVYVLMVVVAYLTHFAALVFIGLALGTCGVVRLALRLTRLGRELYLLAPVGAMLIWHVVIGAGYREPTDVVAESYLWGTPMIKAASLLWDVAGYRSFGQLLVLLALAACLLCAVPWHVRSSRSAITDVSVLEPWVLALAFLAAYAVLPSSYSEASFVDVRTLPLAALFLVIAVVQWRDRARGATSYQGNTAFALAVLVVVLNMGYLGTHFRDDSRWLSQYRAVVAHIPPRSTVLPVYTAVKEGAVRAFLHAASFVVIDREAIIPYLFSGDSGDPMKYFRYRNRPYAPQEDWYGSPRHGSVDWKRVADEYQFVLLMKPIDARRIPLAGQVIAENSSARLLAIPQRGPPGEGSAGVP